MFGSSLLGGSNRRLYLSSSHYLVSRFLFGCFFVSRHWRVRALGDPSTHHAKSSSSNVVKPGRDSVEFTQTKQQIPIPARFFQKPGQSPSTSLIHPTPGVPNERPVWSGPGPPPPGPAACRGRPAGLRVDVPSDGSGRSWSSFPRRRRSAQVQRPGDSPAAMENWGTGGLGGVWMRWPPGWGGDEADLKRTKCLRGPR